MKNNYFKVVMTLCGLVLSVSLHAQDAVTDSHTLGITIPEVALVDIEPAAAKSITMTFTAPVEAGDPLTAPTTENSLWLNYSSIKSLADATRNVSVKLDALVPGVDIKLLASAAAGIGGGTLGAPVPQLTLTAADQIIISGIGSAYTGSGDTNGHQLSYDLSSSASYADLEASTTSVMVTYTISDN